MAIVQANALIPGTGGQPVNFLPNPRAEGAVVGTPGTLPTNWGHFALSGITSQVVGFGTDVTTGLPYCDIRYSGTPSASNFIVGAFNSPGSFFVSVGAGVPLTTSAYVAMVGGNLTNISQVYIAVRVNTAGGNAGNSFIFTPTATLTRYSCTNIGPTIGLYGVTGTWGLTLTIGLPIDVTLRYGPHQLEIGSTPTDIIYPPIVGSHGAWIPKGIYANPSVNPTTISGQGGITNWVDNPNSEGAVVGVIGSGGVWPTNWSVGALQGVQAQIVTTSVDVTTGLAFIDVRIFGTATGIGTTIRFTLQQAVPTVAGDAWAQSTYVALVGGSLTSGVVTIGNALYYYDQNNVNSGSSGGPSLFVPTATLQRFSAPAKTVVGATTRRVWPVIQIGWNNGAAIDFTIRIAAPQLELGTVVTPPILPPPGAPGVTSRALIAAPDVFTNPMMISGQGGTTNYIRNPNLEGAVVGTIGSGGVLPTYWSFLADNTTLSKTVIGTGVDAATGLNYVDIRYFGTTASVATFMVTGLDTQGVPCAPGDQAADSLYMAVVGGSLTNIGGVFLQARANVGTSPSFNFAPSLTGTLQRFSFVSTATAPTTSQQFAWYFSFLTGGVAIDVTFRIAGPQFEKASSVSPLILPPVGAPQVTTRALIAAPDVFTTPTSIAGQGGTTNWIDNPNNENAVLGVIGSGGAWPTNWSSPVTGLAVQIVASGVDPFTGLAYIDVRLFGTTNTASSNIQFTTHVSVPTISNDVWSQSTYVALVGGTLTNVTATQHLLYYCDRTGTVLGNTAATSYTPTATLQRFSAPNKALAVNAATRNVLPALYFVWNNASAVDFTLRIAGPQLERGTVVTPLILPPLGSPGITTRGLLAMPFIANYAQIGGVGSVQADGRRIVFASALIAGVGESDQSPPAVMALASARFNGQGGSVSAEAVGNFARIGGTGSVSATAAVRMAASTTIAGLGGTTNWIRNPRAEGAVIGTPGTLPTFWQWAPGGGLTGQVIGTGTDNGVPYIDLRIFGTSTSANDSLALNMQLDTGGSILVVPGETWTCSCYFKLIAGTLPGRGVNLNAVSLLTYLLNVANGSITFNCLPGGTGFVPNSVTLTRAIGTGTLSDPASYRLVPSVWIYTSTTGQVIDFTIRIGSPQLERGPVSDEIWPPAGAPQISTRALLAMPGVPQYGAARIDGIASVAADSQPMRAANAQIDGVGGFGNAALDLEAGASSIGGAGTVRASATVVAQAIVVIEGGGTNRLPDSVPVPTAPNTVVISTDVPPPLAGATVFKHAPLSTSFNLGGQLTTAFAPLVPHTFSIWVWVPSAYDGAYLTCVAETAGLAGFVTAGNADLSLRDQWQLCVGSTNIAPTGNFNVAIRFEAAHATQPYYTSTWQAVPGQVFASATLPAQAAARVGGTGSVIAPAWALRPTSARIDGTAAVSAPTGTALLPTQATISGVGSVTAIAQCVMPGITRIAGVASVAATTVVNRQAIATIAGVGGATNYIRNPRGEGAIVGTYPPGTNTKTPPWWDTDVNGPAGSTTGMMRQIIGNFTVDGIDVVRLRFWGMPDPSTSPTYAIAAPVFEYTPEYTPGIGFLTGVTEGQTYTRSLYLRLVAGDWSNTQRQTLWGISLDRTNATTPADPRTLIAPLPGATLTRYTDTLTATGGIAPYQIIAFGLTIDRVDPPAYIDITIDIGGGQVELGSRLTALILPPPGTGASTVVGVRGIEALGAALVQAAARINGVGLVASDTSFVGQARGEATIAGVASITIRNPVQLGGARAALHGVGSVAAATISTGTVKARLTGTGSVQATGAVLHPTIARIRGVGEIDARAMRVSYPAALIAGRGGLRSIGFPAKSVDAAIAGSGSLRVSSVALRGAAAMVAGSGTVQAAGKPVTFCGAILDGMGHVRVRASLTRVLVAAQARLTGTGSLRATGSIAQPAVARIEGAGEVFADLDLSKAGRALLDGRGQVVANATALRQTFEAAATIAGAGSLRASTSHVSAHPSDITLAGEGFVTATTRLIAAAPAATTIAGQGSLTATTVRIASHAAQALIAGAGGLAVGARGAQPADATVAGAGGVRARGSVLKAARALLHGLGSLTARYHTAPLEVGAYIAGQGGVEAIAELDAVVRVRIAGHGALKAHASVTVTGVQAKLRGAGAVRAHAERMAPAAALIHGLGRLRAHAQRMAPPQVLAAAALIAGLGALRASARNPIQHAVARIAGAAGLRAYAHGRVPVGAHIAGVAAVRAHSRVLKAAHALIHGLGALVASHHKAPFAVHAHVGGQGSVKATARVRAGAHARIAGHGALVVHVTAISVHVTTTVTIAGHGRVIEHVNARRMMQARLVGVGDLAVDCEQLSHHHTSATIAGVGHVKGDAGTPREQIAAQGVYLPPSLVGVSVL